MSALKAVSSAVNAWNAEYLDQQYASWKVDPNSVSDDLRSFFAGFDLAMTRPGTGGSGGEATSADSLRFYAGVLGLIEAYRNDGHMAAKTDPFGREPGHPRTLTLEWHGLRPGDLQRAIQTDTTPLAPTATLSELVAFLTRTYCQSIGVQFGYVTNQDERRWLIQRCERNSGRFELERGQKAHLLDRLIKAEVFERFLQARYPGEKRFSLEGAESLIILLDRIIEAASEMGVEETVMGMAHRGRLNVLHNILGKTLEQIFTEFEDAWASLVQGGGDVKYHRGYSSSRRFSSGKTMKLVMASNPSHLESVNGVVLGRCRAKQRLANDTKERSRIMPLLIHGDAAVIGQGAVGETLNYSQLEGYRVGGCIHAVINNLIGFTTGPEDARTSRYCTDIAMMIEAPVLHVNVEDPEAVVTCGQIAMEYRQRFKKDIFIDLVCYRKYGHNEQDEASFTQPHLTTLVQRQQNESVLKNYAQSLQNEGVLTPADVQAMSDRMSQMLEAAQKTARSSPCDPAIEPGGWRWKGITGQYTFDPVQTGVPMKTLEEVCTALGGVPDGFNLNPKLTSLLAGRASLPKTKQISYADAESLAFGTLLLDGIAVRISGQDARRGTFSHRHAVLRDTQTEDRYIPLNHMRTVSENPLEAGRPGTDGRPTQAKLCVYDSPLSEMGVLAFDYGYSLADPHMLVCWEAQFGDFANGAQTMIDQYICCAELKWERWSGITLLLPHGYEGAGPEHSSARLERFLQLCANDNMLVVYPSTAAQCFHMFRRQMLAPYRKPLVVLTPKSMLRIPTSSIEELTTGHFRTLLDDPAAVEGRIDRKKVDRVVWCSGKLYHELSARRDARGDRDVAFVRVEQFYPFDVHEAARIKGLYPQARNHVWAQEEPRNMGGYMFVADVFRSNKELGVELEFIGRPAMAASALGSKKADKKQQEQVVSQAVGPAPTGSGSGKDHGAANGSHDAKGASKPAPAKSKR